MYKRILTIVGYYKNSLIKRASRANALRADGVPRTMGLVLTQPISPTPWTRPQNPLGANSSLTIRLLKKDNILTLSRSYTNNLIKDSNVNSTCMKISNVAKGFL